MTVTEQDLADIQARLLTFMDQHIYPNEQRYHDQLNGLADRFSTVPLMEELKALPKPLGYGTFGCRLIMAA